jgi:hypothetical protein
MKQTFIMLENKMFSYIRTYFWLKKRSMVDKIKQDADGGDWDVMETKLYKCPKTIIYIDYKTMD